MVGASGAIYGVLGAYFLWFPQNRVHLFLLIIWLIRVVRVPARWVLGGYVVVADLLPLLSAESGSVAHSAHVGGFAAGLGAAWLAAATGWARGEGARDIHWRRARAATAPRDVFLEAAAAHDWRRALRAYDRLSGLERDGLPSADVFAFSEWLTTRGDHEPALAVLQRFIATHPTSPHLPEAHLRAGLIHLHGLGRRPAAYQHLLAVLDLEATAEEERSARLALAEIEASRDGMAYH
jgi:hypothetical protein